MCSDETVLASTLTSPNDMVKLLIVYTVTGKNSYQLIPRCPDSQEYYKYQHID